MIKDNGTKLPSGADNFDEVSNSLASMTTNIIGNQFAENVPQINKLGTALQNNRYDLIFNNRSLLAQLYVEHGLIQTLIDQPVLDAFRSGIEIKTGQLSPEQIEELEKELEKEKAYSRIEDCLKWGRLFGGSGLVILTDENMEKPLFLETITADTKLTLYPADLWELNLQWYENRPQVDDLPMDLPYMFYGRRVHKTRVLQYKNKEAPSFLRRRMRGWGMTEVERFIRSFNQYLKNHNVIFELLDEAKIDVFKMNDFNAAAASANGAKVVEDRVQMANMLKSHLSSLLLDKEDEYEQKQMNFAGLGDMLTQIRMGVAADLKMPITKLFGVSSAGFNSGEDDIENYNSMIESEIRTKAKPITMKVIEIYCQKLFNYIPDDLAIEFNPLRILSAEQEETVKDSKLNRILAAQGSGLISPEQAKEAINKDNLLPIKIDATNEYYIDNLNGGNVDGT